MGSAGLPGILLIATGGTISMRQDAERGGAVPRLRGEEILGMVPGWERHARVEVREFGRYPGPHMTIERMWALRGAILEGVRGGAEGFVVTHGTDTIEETAYLLDRSLPPVVPVDLVKVVAGADSRLIEASLDSGAHGVVLEALGRGNVPPDAVPGVRRWMQAGKPVVVTSRSLRGRVLDAYAYAGGGHQLREMGVIFGDHLTGQQARIELMLALGVCGAEPERVRETIEWGRYEE